jgi:16S rRNA (adenine(1408)-N(1))-methyltransferase
VIDLGTGDGRFVLATAAREPRTLVVGLDADASRMTVASRRADRAPRKGGLPNATFVVAPAEALPAELSGIADAVTIHFPWGSLLRGVVCAEPWLAGGLRGITKPDATVDVMLSLVERDAVIGLPPLDDREIARVAADWGALGFAVESAGQATADETAATRSTWAKRLGAGRARPAWRLRLRRCCAHVADGKMAVCECHGSGTGSAGRSTARSTG